YHGGYPPGVVAALERIREQNGHGEVTHHCAGIGSPRLATSTPRIGAARSNTWTSTCTGALGHLAAIAAWIPASAWAVVAPGCAANQVVYSARLKVMSAALMRPIVIALTASNTLRPVSCATNFP